MDYGRYEENHLKVEMDDKVAIVTLNRPEKHNAVNAKLHTGLEHLLTELSYDAAVGAIVLTGAGKSFCAGGDLVDFYPPDHTIRNSLRNRRLN
ncbi:MAG: enoyl-CoA hydratase/isomerase family protein, partial [Myxococcota bacterium]